MADDRTQYNCGCGFKTGSPEEAGKHCDETGHMVTVSGTVKPSAGVFVRKAQTAIAQPTEAQDGSIRPVVQTAAAIAYAEAEAQKSAKDFSNLRSRLGKKE